MITPLSANINSHATDFKRPAGTERSAGTAGRAECSRADRVNKNRLGTVASRCAMLLMCAAALLEIVERPPYGVVFSLGRKTHDPIQTFSWCSPFFASAPLHGIVGKDTDAKLGQEVQDFLLGSSIAIDFKHFNGLSDGRLTPSLYTSYQMRFVKS